MSIAERFDVIFRLVRALIIAGIVGAFAGVAFTEPTFARSPDGGGLDAELASREVENLVRRCRVEGDPRRGAAVFAHPAMGCVACHQNADPSKNIGPDLSTLEKPPGYASLIESVLHPNRVVDDRYRTYAWLIDDGTIVTGQQISDGDDAVVTRLSSGEVRRLDPAAIEARRDALSLMPNRLVNALENESQFYDLIAYLDELTRGYPVESWSTPPPPLPEYESDLDHAGLIRSLNADDLRDGENIYRRICANCHGTVDAPGSLPHAVRFASDRLKQGSDPYSMYRTLTHGFGAMAAQRQLVPREKYAVIDYIRNTYFKIHNPSMFAPVNDGYLDALPKGTRRGPDATRGQPWRTVDYGPMLISTYEVTGPDTRGRPTISKAERKRAERQQRPPREVWPPETNFAYKGIAIRPNGDVHRGGGDVQQGGDDSHNIADGSRWVVFDHDTGRVAGAWANASESDDRFIDWQGILMNGRHAVAPRTVGRLHYQNGVGPGWSIDGDFSDPRPLGLDGRPYGPLPRDRFRYRGLNRIGNRVILRYEVDATAVMETHDVDVDFESDAGAKTVWYRTVWVDATDQRLTTRIADSDRVSVNVAGDAEVVRRDGHTFIVIPPKSHPRHVRIAVSVDSDVAKPGFAPEVRSLDLPALLADVPKDVPNMVHTQVRRGDDVGGFTADTLELPTGPGVRLRVGGLDFDSAGRIVVAMADGDVWRCESHPTSDGETLRWTRYAQGLHQPLGLKIVDDVIYVSCRDQIVRLHDRNGDGRADDYECFNNDHQVTDHFHEFAMGLQTDREGRFYYAKSARHAREALVPHHGTLIRVAADGSSSTIIATGFRAANGVCLNPDGSFFVTDQEGHWMPMNRVNRVPPAMMEHDATNATLPFFGNRFIHKPPKAEPGSDAEGMTPPLCWVDRETDRSPAELLWVDSPAWGRMDGTLMSVSYGYGKIFAVALSRNGETGGLCELPIPSMPDGRFPTGLNRGRFNPHDGHLYVGGMSAWATDQMQTPGGLFRIRRTGRPMRMPTGIDADVAGQTITITMSDPVDVESVDSENFAIESWDLRRSRNYGSPRIEPMSWSVRDATLIDPTTIELDVPSMTPRDCVEIRYKLRGDDQRAFTATVQTTVR